MKELNEKFPFAELWMGSHVKNPSKVQIETEEGVKEIGLDKYLEDN